MIGPWHLLRSLLREAKSTSDYKEDIFRYVTRRYGEHAADELRSAMKSMKFGEFRRHAALTHMDPQLDSRIEALAQHAMAAYRARQAGEASPKPQSGQTQGRSGRIYTDPDAEAERQAKIDAMRQARATGGAGGQSAAQALMTPGRGGAHAVGSAGQNQPRTQPSIAAGVRPQYSADQLKKMNVGRSGIVRAQRAVDKETREKGQAAGEKLAKALGVPSTAERTVFDQDTGSKTIQIWGPDRVLKHMDVDQRPDAPQDPKRTVRIGDRDVPASRTTAARSAPDRVDLIKRGVLSRSAAPAPGKMGPSRPGSFPGERWKPHRREEEAPGRVPNPATGNWMNFKRQVNPKHTGQELVWNKFENEWELLSVFAAKEAERGGRGRGDFDEEDPTDPGAPAFEIDDEE